MGEPQKFAKLVEDAVKEFKTNKQLQKYFSHNLSYYFKVHASRITANSNSLDVDLRDEYWWKPEVRIAIKFLDEIFQRDFYPPTLVRKTLFEFCRMLREIRVAGKLDDLDAQGHYESPEIFRQDVIKISRSLPASLPQLLELEKDLRTQNKRVARLGHSLLDSFGEFLKKLGDDGEWKQMDTGFSSRLKYMPYFSAKSEDEVVPHARFFSAWYTLFTSTNAYQSGGAAQNLGPILGNSSTKSLLDLVNRWVSGQSLKETKFVVHDAHSKTPTDRSPYTAVMELYGFCRLSKVPIINKSVANRYLDQLDLEPEDLFGLQDYLGNEFSNFPKESETRAFAEQFLTQSIPEALSLIQTNLAIEETRNPELHEKYSKELLSVIFTKELRETATKYILELNSSEKGQIALELIVDSLLHAEFANEKTSDKSSSGTGEELIATESKGIQYWLIGTGENKSQWEDFTSNSLIAIGWDALGDLGQYSDEDVFRKKFTELYKPEKQPHMSTLACLEFSRSMKVGDVVIAKHGKSTILGVGIISSEYIFDQSRKNFKHIRRVDWKKTGEWDAKEHGNFVLKTLTNITKYPGYPERLLRTAEFESPVANDTTINETTEYTANDALSRVYVPPIDFGLMIDFLRTKKNIVLEGPPGVGKTFVAREIAKVLTNGKSENIEFVQFHQSYSYEDFVQGIRPSPSGGFKVTNGIFLDFCERARNSSDNFIFIIDEINRGNLSKIFGELMMLIEADKRDYEISLTYKQGGAKFSIPRNVHIIGTMNTADRSLSLVDYALRRRFAFFKLSPRFDSNQYKEHLLKNGLSESEFSVLRATIDHLNQRIRDDKKYLGEGFQIGHAYFREKPAEKSFRSWFDEIVKYELEPLLREYWFDNLDLFEDAVKELRAVA